MSRTPAITTIPLGASIYRFEVDGHNILLSYPDPALHASHPHPFFGETIGRVANRIENAKLPDLNGQSYDLNPNNGPNTLHGGNLGWGKAVWKGPTHVRKGTWDSGIVEVLPTEWAESSEGAGRAGVKYEHLSPHGDEKFPGAVRGTVWYFEGRDASGKVVLESEYEVEFAGETAGVDETVVSMTNHRCVALRFTEYPLTSSYFNLNARVPSSSPDLSSHELLLSTAIHQTLSENPGIPDGTLTPHPNVPAPNHFFPLFDPSTRAAVPIDDCFIVSPRHSPADIPLDTRAAPLHLLAELRSTQSNLTLRVESTEPAFQAYTGGFIDVPAWSAGEVESRAYAAGPGFARNAGVCIEPSRFVNSAGRNEWRSMVLLKRGGMYGARSRYTAWKV